MGLYLGGLVVFTTLFLTKYFPYNREDATDTTAMNIKFKVHYIKVRAFSHYSGKFFDSSLCSRLEC